MAHLGVGFLTLASLSLVLAEPKWFTAILIVPVLDVLRDRPLPHHHRPQHRHRPHPVRQPPVPWTDIDGLRFDRRSWALACLKDGSEFRLPAVTFATLPELTAASGGPRTNPYE